MARNAALLHERDKRITERFNELFKEEYVGNGKRYEIIIEKLEGEFHLRPRTIESILKKPYPDPAIVRKVIVNKKVKRKSKS